MAVKNGVYVISHVIIDSVAESLLLQNPDFNTVFCDQNFSIHKRLILRC